MSVERNASSAVLSLETVTAILEFMEILENQEVKKSAVGFAMIDILP